MSDPDHDQPGAERRLKSAARYEIDSDPRHLREMLSEVERTLTGVDERVRRRVALLVGELVGRISERPRAHGKLHMEIHERPSSLRVDMWDEAGQLDDEFWRRLADSALVGLATAWGRDRRREAGAWFEIAVTDSRRRSISRV